MIISRAAYSDLTKHGSQPRTTNAWGVLLGAKHKSIVQVALPVGERRYLSPRRLDPVALQDAWHHAGRIADSKALIVSGCYYTDVGSESDYDDGATRQVLADLEWLPVGAFVLLRYLFGGETFWDPELFARRTGDWTPERVAIGRRRLGHQAINPRRVRATWQRWRFSHTRA